MSPQDWVALGKQLGFQGIVVVAALVVFWFLGKKLVEALVAQVPKMLDHQRERELAILQSNLGLAGHAQNVSFDMLHQKRAEAIFRLAELFDVFQSSMARLTTPLGFQGDPTKPELAERSRQAGNEFLSYYYAHQILFEESTCELIDEIAKVYQKAYMNMTLYTSYKEGTQRDSAEYWIKADDVVNKEAPPLVKKMRDEFRRILGVSVKEPAGNSSSTSAPPTG